MSFMSSQMVESFFTNFRTTRFAVASVRMLDHRARCPDDRQCYCQWLVLDVRRIFGIVTRKLNMGLGLAEQVDLPLPCHPG